MINNSSNRHMPYIETVVMHCLNLLKGERTIYSVYHLLKGKKSAQTIQDSYLYSLFPLFKVYGNLDRTFLEEVVLGLVYKKFIREITSQRYLLTQEGIRVLKREMNSFPLPEFLNGLKYHSSSVVFWERLSLLVQVCSHLARSETQYIPIVKNKDAQFFIKALLSNRGPSEREELGRQLHRELLSILENSHSISPDVFVLRLSGFKRAGLTSNQVARRLDLDEFYCHLVFLGTLHLICISVSEQEGRYPLLQQLAKVESDSAALTLTARQTLKYLNKGYTIDEISIVRSLKKSTIEDHIVELALHDNDFSIAPYVSEEEEDLLKGIVAGTSSRQLKFLKEQSGGVSYFKIRLVLAKLGES